MGLDCRVAQSKVQTSPSVAVVQLGICCRDAGRQAKPRVLGAGCKGQRGKSAEQGALEVMGKLLLQGTRVPSAHPCAQRMGLGATARLSLCSGFAFSAQLRMHSAG